ncbi:hypothetical protein N7507_007308 [Penicillium longicatenatum]|nr:hypothetical protein N7507_007308 [Penicillium longicatenatum]
MRPAVFAPFNDCCHCFQYCEDSNPVIHMAWGAPILTIGDGIASFLRRSDIYSQGMCLPCEGSAAYIHPFRAISSSLYTRAFRHLVVYRDKRRRWGSSALLVLFFGLFRIGSIGSDIWATKLGDITSQTIISTGSSHTFVTNSHRTLYYLGCQLFALIQELHSSDTGV